MSKRNVSFLYFMLIIFASIAVYILSNLGYEDVTSSEEAQVEVSAQMSDGELILKGTEVLLETIESEREAKKIKDSIRVQKRGEKWVYKIGTSYSGKDLKFYDLYKDISHIGNVNAFREDRNSYFLIKDDNLSRMELESELNVLKESLAGHSKIRIEILDLHSYCKPKESIIAGKKVKWRKADVEIPCLICGK